MCFISSVLSDNYRCFVTIQVVPLSKTTKLVNLVRRRQIVRPRDLSAVGIPRNYLARLVRRGELQQLGRGLYTTDVFAASEHISLLEVSMKSPRAVICLLSALRFHEIGTQVPHEVWIGVDVKAWAPRITSPAIRIVRFSGDALRYGVRRQKVAGGTIQITDPAKTVADCFKFRNKIGLDVALEALRDCHRQKKASMNQLWKAAKVCRVANVMKPYLEMLG